MRTPLYWEGMSLADWAVYAIEQIIRNKRNIVEDSSRLYRIFAHEVYSRLTDLRSVIVY